jgi:hypothetical protein
MVIDLSGVKDNSFLGEGKHLVKIVSVEKVTTEWNTESLKITFADKDGFCFSEFFPLERERAWKLKVLAKTVNALDRNDQLDTDMLIGKYLYITIGTYTNKQGKEILTIKKFEKSKLNENVKNQYVVSNPEPKNELPENVGDITEDMIPF